MPKSNLVTIDKIEVKRSELSKIKKIFKAKDNAEAIKTALHIVSGKVELECFFEKHKGTKIEKVYA